MACCHPLLLGTPTGRGAPGKAEAALGGHNGEPSASLWVGRGPSPKAANRHQQGQREGSGAGGAKGGRSAFLGTSPQTLEPHSTWFSTCNWITNSMLVKDHTLMLPSSQHVAQWDSLGLKTTSFTCREPASLV